MSFKDLMTYKRILIRHIYTSVISWWNDTHTHTHTHTHALSHTHVLPHTYSSTMHVDHDQLEIDDIYKNRFMFQKRSSNLRRLQAEIRMSTYVHIYTHSTHKHTHIHQHTHSYHVIWDSEETYFEWPILDMSELDSIEYKNKQTPK